MSISKLKIAFVTTALSLASFASPAYAQISVEDVDANSILREIQEEAKEEYDRFNDFRTDRTIPHYDAEIKRLDTMIKALSYYNEEGVYEGDGRDLSHFDIVEGSDATRDRVTEILQDAIQPDGLTLEFESLDTGSGTIDTIATAIFGESPPTAYLTEYGFLPPQNKHEEDGPLQKKVAKLYSALFIADSMIGGLAETRIQRLEAYDNLREKAKATESVQQAIEVNNALLIENGRNLALLIDLQMVRLNAEAVALRDNATSKNKSEESFGGTALGTVALAGISDIVNEVTD